ncbi:sulfotransferase family protein [Sphingobium chlorophenolicum]|uniref:sulfotransferase family protein n=1 Tax=Sphingobium chlorophenolicum TaxID=46429 RepID=UPI0020B80E39|nr:sulfotransferase [Sphingobium chlorophenolicum]
MTPLVTDAILPLRDAEAPPMAGRTTEAAAPAAERGAIRLIYVAGYGRSGTTLLDIALGEHPAIMGAGEVTTLARHVWDRGEYCACGARVRDCPEWKAIVARWTQGEPEGFLAAYRRAQERTEGLVAPGRWLRWPGWRDHRRQTLKLLRGMAAVSGRPILVDSSKLPGRAFALAAMPGIDLHVVHVVRDGRGVAWSLMKGHRLSVEKGVQRELRPKPLLYTALRWSMVNLAAEMLCRRVGPGRAIRVRYEDFVDDPRREIGRIVTLVGERPHLPADGLAPFEPRHQVAGSRHRMRKSLTIRGDDKWKRDMPGWKRKLFTLLCAPLLRRYGYSLRSGDAS